MNELQLRALSVGLKADATLEQVEQRERDLSNLETRAHFIPSTLNEEKRTMEVVFVTETPCRLFTWEDGPVDEILLCEPANVRQERFKSGIAVLDNHDRYSGTKGQIGVVENYRFEKGQGFATVRFSKRKDVEENQWQDAKDGILRGISVGYKVHKYEITKEDGKRAVYTATDWEVLEVSFAPVQADPNSAVRASTSSATDNSNKNSDNSQNPHTMNELQKRALAAGLAITATLEEVVRAESAKQEAEEAKLVQARKEAAEAERKRHEEITEAVRAVKLDDKFAAKLIKDGKSIDECRALIIAEKAKENPEIDGANRGATVGKEQIEKSRKAAEDAVIHRLHGGELSAEAREFRGHSLIDLARHFLQENGVNTNQLSRQDIAKMSLGLANSRGYHSTSDFPNILAAVVNKTLRKAYDMQTRTFNPFVRKTTNPDFKTITRAQLSGLVGGFDVIAEGGEYKHASFSDGKETYSLVKYGKKFTITWEALINDDLSAFDRIPSAIAAKAVQKQSDIVYGILTGNPNMSDAVALFHANHGNLAGAGTTIPNGIAAARAAMRKQTDPNGDFINVAPRFLVCGPDKETEAQQLLNASIVAAKTVDTNVFRGSHELIVEPRLTGNQWYTIADPALIDTIELCFLEGEGELFTERRTAFDQDGLEIKARSVFAAKAIDWRGMYKNAGA